ncbi:MAG: cyclase family protein [Paenibacillaceae bacterium]|nr:cyclase family protein [Paenibacillaceae bacterium]
MFVRLSYTMAEDDPGWPGNFTMKTEVYTSIAAGDIANQTMVTLHNHFGSHMDGPKHFNDRGPRLCELPLETFIYDEPYLLDIPKSYGELVQAAELFPHLPRLQRADLLMIRSGFSASRRTDPERYAGEGPGISAEACRLLMDHCPNLKAIALDWISLASYVHPEEGILAHQLLLGSFHPHFICIIEDLDFTALQGGDGLKRVLAVPVFIANADSSPVTVLAEVQEPSLQSK